MIIVEGPDNSGKSTLCEKLGKEFDLNIIHSVKPCDRWTEDLTFLNSNAQLFPGNHILDRVYVISEYIYGNIIRGKTALGYRHRAAFLDLFFRRCLVIYCRPPNEAILNTQKTEMEGVRENHLAIIQEYDRVMKILRCNGVDGFTYNWKNYESLKYGVEGYLQSMKIISKNVEEHLV